MATVPDKSGNGRGGEAHLLSPDQILYNNTFVKKSGDVMTGRLDLPSGNQAAPSLTFGTVNTGIYGASATTVGISGSGIARLSAGATQVTAASKLVTVASATNAGFIIPPGAAPGAPVNGDMWSTAAGLFVQINGATKSVNLT